MPVYKRIASKIIWIICIFTAKWYWFYCSLLQSLLLFYYYIFHCKKELESLRERCLRKWLLVPYFFHLYQYVTFTLIFDIYIRKLSAIIFYKRKSTFTMEKFVMIRRKIRVNFYHRSISFSKVISLDVSGSFYWAISFLSTPLKCKIKKSVKKCI